MRGPYDAAVQIDYREAWARSDATIRELPLEAPGRVPWWPQDRNPVTLHWILVHVATETHRHAGHADIVRELIDGAAGLRKENSNMPDVGGRWWAHHRGELERVAEESQAGQQPPA
jgi:hypothetical protein